ncbi:MAG: hypothetical protein JXB46_01655 [Candidatus Eisenbacteria bacterium]|nr:hypothetical protein [Candidatus Eisenbacteria bacterium]
MRFPMAALAAATLALILSLPSASITAESDTSSFFVPLDELSRGDRCIGKTVFSGTEVEEFELEILGIVRGVGPGSNMIIGRAEGPLLEKTGILQGMSGSPVYKDGRLVGAVASTWAYTKEPIAGITPIGEMLPALELEGRPESGRGAGPGGSPWGVQLLGEQEIESSSAFRIASILGMAAATVNAPGSTEVSFADRSMVPLAAPLVVSGASDDFLARAAAVLGDGVSLASGGAGSARQGDAELVPGSAVGVQFVRGDADWTAVGTVTHVEGDRLVAFGHPLFGAGPMEMPMVSAYVHALLPLQSVSFKYASGGPLLGTMTEDRDRTVAGRLGAGPRMLPVRVSVAGALIPTRPYRFEVVESRPYTALFAGLAVGGAISGAARATGPATIWMSVRIDTGHEIVEYSDVLRTTEPAMRTAGELSLLLSVIAENEFAFREFEEVDVDVRVDDDAGWILIDRVDADRLVYRPGEDVVLRVRLRPVRGEPFERRLLLELPESLSEGQLTVRVGGAESYHLWERDRLGMGIVPRSYDQLLELIRRSKSGDTVIAQAFSERPGFSLLGDEMKGVPGKAGLAMASGATSGAFDPSAVSLLSEDEFAVDGHVSGYHELKLWVRKE